MHNKVVFYTLFLALVLAGCWGVVRMGLFSLGAPEELPINSTVHRHIDNAPLTDALDAKPDNTNKILSETGIKFDDIKSLIRSGDARQAANAINQRYSYLSRGDLDQLKQEFLNSAARAKGDNKKDILHAASGAFDSLDIWKALAKTAIIATDWRLAFGAQLRASELENDPIELEILLRHLAQSSRYLRAEFEKNNDEFSVRSLYQRLVDLHPNFNLFQLELANTHARLQNYQAAEKIYESLNYDVEFGDIAQRALTKIKARQNPQTSVATTQGSDDNTRANDIVVPLIVRGSSFLIDVSIERQTSRFLLDTGASITALSKDLIQRLNLTPTGQSIQLSTANGLTSARLYRVKSLSFGRLKLTNIVVAEINLGRRNGFDGLLGTDALNQLKPRYSYVIDNRKNALIFRGR